MKTLEVLRSTRKKAALVASVAALALGLSACSGDAAGGGGENPYRVGVLLGLTGNYAALGVPSQHAFELYVDQVIEDGGTTGHPVELVVLDGASDEGTAINQIRQLAVEEPVPAVLGPSSSG